MLYPIFTIRTGSARKTFVRLWLATQGPARRAARQPRQAEIIRLIGALKPDAALPPDSGARQDYEVLYGRFLLGLTQEQAAGRLGLSVRSLQRAQREATHVLARQFWERSRQHGAPDRLPAGREPAPSPPDRWLSQVRQELLLLQQSAPDAECALEEAIAGALRIEAATGLRHVSFTWNPTGHGPWVCFHPTALRQVFLNLISSLARAMPSGTIAVTLAPLGDVTMVTFTASPVPSGISFDVSLVHELLSARGGTVQTAMDGDTLVLEVILPSLRPPEKKTTVLVVDDNADVVDLYHSYCAETPFELVHIREGRRVFEAVEAARPDIILLDMMLPDLDGWDLLLELHVHPLTRLIPIIVCSVVTDEQLVLDLGAALYLRKPVWDQQLLDAFASVLPQA